MSELTEHAPDLALIGCGPKGMQGLVRGLLKKYASNIVYTYVCAAAASTPGAGIDKEALFRACVEAKASRLIVLLEKGELVATARHFSEHSERGTLAFR